MGNVDPLEVMINDTAQEVYRKAHECLSVFSDRPGYMLSVGGGLNQGIPAVNIIALVDTTKEFGT